MSRTSALTRKPKGLGTQNFAQGYPRSHVTPILTSRSKGQKWRSAGAGAYCGGHLATQLVSLTEEQNRMRDRASRHCTTGGSCLSSPTSTNLREWKSGLRLAHSETCDASSTMQTSNVRCENNAALLTPRHVVATTGYKHNSNTASENDLFYEWTYLLTYLLTAYRPSQWNLANFDAAWWNKINLKELVDICGYELPTNLQNFTQTDLIEVKIFQKKFRGGSYFFETPCICSCWKEVLLISQSRHNWTILQQHLSNENPGKPVPELSETLTHYISPSLSSNSSQALQTFSPSLPLESNTKQNLAETAERNMTNPRTRTHTSVILA